MTTKKIKPCPLPDCGGVGHQVEITGTVNMVDIECTQCLFRCSDSAWEALPRVSDAALAAARDIQQSYMLHPGRSHYTISQPRLKEWKETIQSAVQLKPGGGNRRLRQAAKKAVWLFEGWNRSNPWSQEPFLLRQSLVALKDLADANEKQEPVDIPAECPIVPTEDDGVPGCRFTGSWRWCFDCANGAHLPVTFADCTKCTKVEPEELDGRIEELEEEVDDLRRELKLETQTAKRRKEFLAKANIRIARLETELDAAGKQEPTGLRIGYDVLLENSALLTGDLMEQLKAAEVKLAGARNTLLLQQGLTRDLELMTKARDHAVARANKAEDGDQFLRELLEIEQAEVQKLFQKGGAQYKELQTATAEVKRLSDRIETQAVMIECGNTGHDVVAEARALRSILEPQQPDENKGTCPACVGAGEVESLHGVDFRCDECGGTGEIVLPDIPEAVKPLVKEIERLVHEASSDCSTAPKKCRCGEPLPCQVCTTSVGICTCGAKDWSFNTATGRSECTWCWKPQQDDGAPPPDLLAEAQDNLDAAEQNKQSNPRHADRLTRAAVADMLRYLKQEEPRHGE